MKTPNIFAGAFASVFLLLFGVTAPSHAITYNINVFEGGNSVTGTITTDGALGLLSSTDILQWSLVVNAGLGGHITLGTSVPFWSGSPLVGATTQLVFTRAGSVEFGDGFVALTLEGASTVLPGGAMDFRETGGGTFRDNLVLLPVEGGNFIQIGSADFTPPVNTPLPAALPLFATGFGALGLLGWRRKRKQVQAIAA